MLSLQPSWASYMITGLLAMVASLVLSSCRVGNNVEKTPNPDQITGFYTTEAQSIDYCGGTTTTNCAAGDTKSIPDMVSKAITNPVALLMKDLGTGDAYLANASGTGEYLPVVVNGSTQTLTFTGNTAPSTLWVYSECKTQITYASEGQFDKSGGGKSAAGQDIQGRVQLRVTVTRLFTGTCIDSLQELYNCYHGSDDCRGSNDSENKQIQASVQDMFNPYIKTGAISPYDIPNLTSLSYTVHYK